MRTTAHIDSLNRGQRITSIDDLRDTYGVKGGETEQMSDNGIVNIHGKQYVTVAARVKEAHEDEVFDELETEVLSHSPVVVKATVTIKGKTYTGISAANPSKSIEKQSPYEVAETSAVGRALGFAGYGVIESIASADEMAKANLTPEEKEMKESVDEAEKQPAVTLTCSECGEPATEKKGISKKTGKQYHGIFCSTENTTHTKWLWN